MYSEEVLKDNSLTQTYKAAINNDLKIFDQSLV